MGGKLTATINKNGDVCAIQKAGGEGVMQSVIMQCLRIAAVKAADITSKIKSAVELYISEKTLRKIKRLPNPVVDGIETDEKDIDLLLEEMEKMKTEEQTVHQSRVTGNETLLTKKVGSHFWEGKAKRVIAGPSNWNPYSKGIDVDLLKGTQVDAVVLNVDEKTESVMAPLTMSGQSPVEIPLLNEMAMSRGGATKGATLGCSPPSFLRLNHVV